MKRDQLLNEALEILRQLVYYSQIYTVQGVRPADMDTHADAWRKGRDLLQNHCVIKNDKYVAE